MSQSINVALPSWLMEPENQIYVLLGFFCVFVGVPMFVISQTKSDTKTHDNGIDRRSDELMMAELMNMIENNMKKKKKEIENDQFIEVMENSLELIAFNYSLAKKINIRDLIRNKINGQKPAEKFADIDS